MFTKIYEWIVWSSKNAEKWSLTVKGFITGSALVGILTMFKIVLPTEDISALMDNLVILIQGLATVATAAVSAWALIRKVYRTIVGKNDLLNKYY